VHWQLFPAGAALAFAFLPACASAQDGAVPGQSMAPVAGPDCNAALVIPALTPVRLELLAPLGSKISKSGDSFPIRLAEPLVIDGTRRLPAGVAGMGEVVHAKKAGGSGAPGELVLAARYLEVCGRRLRLRSMHLSPTGTSSMNTVNALNVASAASPLPIGLLGFAIHGGQVTVPTGTIADAKTAEGFGPASSTSEQGDAAPRVEQNP
jgi:hypothetical protein